MTLSSNQQHILIQTTFIFLLISLASLTFSIAVSSMAFGVAAVLAATVLVATKNMQPTPFDYYFLAYAAAEILSTLFSVDPTSSFVNMKRLLLIAVVYLTVMSLDTRKKYIFTIILVATVTALLSAVESFLLIGGGDFSARLSMFQHYMTAGGIKMFVALMILPFLLERQLSPRWRVIASVSTLPILLALILTQTRSSWLGFLAGSVVIGIVKNKTLLIGVVLTIVLFFLFAPNTFTARALSIVDPSHPSNLTRINMITTGWRMFLDYPLFGTGDIDLKKLYVTYTDPIDPAEGGHLHNNFMTLLVTLGGVGFIAVIALFIKIFLAEWNIVQRLRNSGLYGTAALGCFAAYVGFQVNGLFEWNFGDHEIAVLLWFSVGLALVSQKLHNASVAESRT